MDQYQTPGHSRPKPSLSPQVLVPKALEVFAASEWFELIEPKRYALQQLEDAWGNRKVTWHMFGPKIDALQRQ